MHTHTFARTHNTPTQAIAARRKAVLTELQHTYMMKWRNTIYKWYLDKERKAVNIVIDSDRDWVFDI